MGILFGKTETARASSPFDDEPQASQESAQNPKSDTSLSRRQWLQFSTKSLLLITTATSLKLGYDDYQERLAHFEEAKEHWESVKSYRKSSPPSNVTYSLIRVSDALKQSGWPRSELVSDAEYLEVMRPHVERQIQDFHAEAKREHPALLGLRIQFLSAFSSLGDISISHFVSERELDDMLQQVVKEEVKQIPRYSDDLDVVLYRINTLEEVCRGTGKEVSDFVDWTSLQKETLLGLATRTNDSLAHTPSIRGDELGPGDLQVAAKLLEILDRAQLLTDNAPSTERRKGVGIELSRRFFQEAELLGSKTDSYVWTSNDVVKQLNNATRASHLVPRLNVQAALRLNPLEFALRVQRLPISDGYRDRFKKEHTLLLPESEFLGMIRWHGPSYR